MAKKMVARSDRQPLKYDDNASDVAPGQVVYLHEDFGVDADGDVLAFGGVLANGRVNQSMDLGYVRFADLRPADAAEPDLLKRAAQLLGYDIDVDRLVRVADRLAGVDLS